MLVKKNNEIKGSEITDENLYLNRRNFIRGAMLVALTTATGLLYRKLAHRNLNKTKLGETSKYQIAGTNPPELATSFEDITNYNNFYEFSTNKSAVAEESKNFIARPWSVYVGGLVNKPKTFDLDDLIKLATVEDRVYRMRCVEGWSMVIPWLGFSLSKLLNAVEPNSEAKFVKFTTLLDDSRFPNQNYNVLPWPYVEGLRLDEAMIPLTTLAVGLYGKMLLPQNGAPLRLVIPWKYGFKSIKSIVRIELTKDQPVGTWNKVGPNEYGFYSNVNPNVSHPRWSQATERRIGEFRMRDTLLFNGYGDQVAHLYSGMDLKTYF